METTYLNITETAKLLRVSRPTVYRLISEGKLTVHRNPAYKDRHGPVLIPLSDIEKLKAKP